MFEVFVKVVAFAFCGFQTVVLGVHVIQSGNSAADTLTGLLVSAVGVVSLGILSFDLKDYIND